jgi:hypothetical protein
MTDTYDKLNHCDDTGAVGYNPDTGNLFWLKSGYNRKTGNAIGHLKPSGYLYICHGGKQILAHRMIWKIMTGAWPEHQVDHVNGVKTDNRWANLRKRSTNKSGFKGVHWCNSEQRWVAQIRRNYKKFRLGAFATPEEAHAAYVAAATEMHGEFSRT